MVFKGISLSKSNQISFGNARVSTKYYMDFICKKQIDRLTFVVSLYLSGCPNPEMRPIGRF